VKGVQIERRHLVFRSGPFPYPFPIALGRRVIWPTPDLDRLSGLYLA
jgi:hypothetical protein